MGEVNNFFSWDLALTVPGAAIMVGVIISVLKSVFSVDERITKIATLVVSMAITIMTTVLYGDPTWSNIVLAVFNGAVVTLAVLQVKNVTIPALRDKF